MITEITSPLHHHYIITYFSASDGAGGIFQSDSDQSLLRGLRGTGGWPLTLLLGRRMLHLLFLCEEGLCRTTGRRRSGCGHLKRAAIVADCVWDDVFSSLGYGTACVYMCVCVCVCVCACVCVCVCACVCACVCQINDYISGTNVQSKPPSLKNNPIHCDRLELRVFMCSCNNWLTITVLQKISPYHLNVLTCRE